MRVAVHREEHLDAEAGGQEHASERLPRNRPVHPAPRDEPAAQHHGSPLPRRGRNGPAERTGSIACEKYFAMSSAPARLRLSSWIAGACGLALLLKRELHHAPAAA